MCQERLNYIMLPNIVQIVYVSKLVFVDSSPNRSNIFREYDLLIHLFHFVIHL